MKESSWSDCLEENSAFSVSADNKKAKSLSDISKGRIDFLEKQDVADSNANYIFENYYTSITEIIHAIALLRGYKILNHVCVGFFIRDVLKTEALFRIYDDLRFKRNSLVYYGRKMDLETAKKSIQMSRMLIKEIDRIFKKEIGRIRK